MGDQIVVKIEMNVADQQRLAFYLQLSGRQREIVCGVLWGMINRQIAEVLYIDPGAVANHLTEIYTRLKEVQEVVISRRTTRFDLVYFFGDFFERYPHLDKVAVRKVESGSSRKS